MRDTVTAEPGAGHRERLEIGRAAMAKADLKNLEVSWREQVGHAIQRCFSLAGLTQKEAAALLKRDAAQVQRWIAGSERPQLDALFGVAQLRGPLVIALAELSSEIDVITEIRVRRTA